MIDRIFSGVLYIFGKIVLRRGTICAKRVITGYIISSIQLFSITTKEKILQSNKIGDLFLRVFVEYTGGGLYYDEDFVSVATGKNRILGIIVIKEELITCNKKYARK